STRSGGIPRAETSTAAPPGPPAAGHLQAPRVIRRRSAHERKGSFTLIHQGTMRRGADYQMRIVVVPDSATEELNALGGALTITIGTGGHFYDFDYTLPASR